MDSTRDCARTELPDSPQIGTSCDYGQVCDKLEKLKPFPVDRAALIGLALSVALPAMPTVLAEVPLSVILTELMGA
jgi:hypothetical protein